MHGGALVNALCYPASITNVIQVITTVDSHAGALAIARRLVERKLAACAQVSGPITSAYWWEGAVQTDEEWYCVIKTRADRYDDVEEEIVAAHPYDEPEILAVPVVAGSSGYLQWVQEWVGEGP